MSDRELSKFRERQVLIARAKEKQFSHVADQELVDRCLAMPSNYPYLAKTPSVSDIDTQSSAIKLIKELEGQFNKQRLDGLMDEVFKGVLSSVAGAFSMGKLLSAYDKTGGNVTTIHNAKQGIYASDEDKYDRDDYDKTKNSNGETFKGKSGVGSQFTRSQMDENKNVTDAYTGEVVKADTTSPDHIVSLNEYHNNGGFMQTKTQRADFGTDPDNLALTNRSINQSMSADDKDEWLDKKSNGRDQTNAEYFGVDRERVAEQKAKGEATAAKHAPTNTDKAIYYGENAAKTGVNEGGKMAAQQVVGALIVELMSAVIIEVKDAFTHGKEGDDFISDLTIRFKRVGGKIIGKWKTFLVGGLEGFASGFVSNVLTTLINIFATTAKRSVRLIREGIFSLLKALKIVLLRPNGISYKEAMHEALKLLAAGGVVIGGVLLEEALDKTLTGLPFASELSVVLVGSISALAVSLSFYLIDKMDLFGVKNNERVEFILGQLDQRIAEDTNRFNEVSLDIDRLLASKVIMGD